MLETSGRFLNEVQTKLLCKEASSIVAKQRQVKSAASGRPSRGVSFATLGSATSRATKVTPSSKYLTDVSGATGSISYQHRLFTF